MGNFLTCFDCLFPKYNNCCDNDQDYQQSQYQYVCNNTGDPTRPNYNTYNNTCEPPPTYIDSQNSQYSQNFYSTSSQYYRPPPYNPLYYQQ
jgi:hypothetical protein